MESVLTQGRFLLKDKRMYDVYVYINGSFTIHEKGKQDYMYQYNSSCYTHLDSDTTKNIMSVISKSHYKNPFELYESLKYTIEGWNHSINSNDDIDLETKDTKKEPLLQSQKYRRYLCFKWF